MKIRIKNMACGHCRLKIEAELRQVGFEYIDFNMLDDIIELSNEEGDFKIAKRAVEKAGYLVDLNYSEEKKVHLVRISSHETYEELMDILERIEANAISFKNSVLEVHYKVPCGDILEILDIFGIESNEHA